MNTERIATTESSELPDFSVILGGPFFQLLRRTHLMGDALEVTGFFPRPSPLPVEGKEWNEGSQNHQNR